MMSAARPAAEAAECRALLESARPAALHPDDLRRLAAAPEAALDTAMREYERAHGAAALPLVEALADTADRGIRKIARRSLYRLRQRGVASDAPRAARPVVERRAERPARAWMSGVDGSGSRAVWIVFEGGFGGAMLCSMIVNDAAGILEAAGGEVTRKRLDRELSALRASQKLPWIEAPPERAVATVAAAMARHRERGTTPPASFERWRRFFAAAPAVAGPDPPGDPSLAPRGVELLDLPELAGWFVDPERVQSDAVELLQARESRLVVSDRVKAEREAEIVARVTERELGGDARRLWAGRLREMAYVFEKTGRAEAAAIARGAAAALPEADAARDPFLTALARRGLEYAGEVTAGRVRAQDVSRAPR